MLRAFRKPKFVTKSKSNIKMLQLRLETIKKRRTAVQKYLKSDIAYLLRSGLDINAYGRAEGLLAEQNMYACYELTEKYIECISNNLSLMQNQRECPEECKEAVPSLMYAAARFADLPELRDLRNLYTERYGNSLEPYINKEFVERLRSKPPTKEMKIQLFHDIAQEFSIEWDSKALEQKLYTPPPLDQGQHRYVSPGDTDNDMHKSDKREDNAFLNRRNQDAGEKLSHATDYTASVGSEVDTKSHESKDASYGRHKLHSSTEDETTTDVSIDAPKYSTSSVGSTSGDEADNRMPFYSKYVPPPYYKPRPVKNEEPTDDHNDVSVLEDNPKPRSVRRTKLKPPPGHENLGRNDRTRHGDDSDPRDEEDRIMDELLMHYSNKPSIYESSQTKGNPKSCLNHEDNDAGESTSHRSRKPERDAPSARASSLPPEPTTPIEEPKGHARANSLQPDAHVHPKLPKYDELPARIAALRGT